MVRGSRLLETRSREQPTSSGRAPQGTEQKLTGRCDSRTCKKITGYMKNSVEGIMSEGRETCDMGRQWTIHFHKPSTFNQLYWGIIYLKWNTQFKCTIWRVWDKHSVTTRKLRYNLHRPLQTSSRHPVLSPPTPPILTRLCNYSFSFLFWKFHALSGILRVHSLFVSSFFCLARLWDSSIFCMGW